MHESNATATTTKIGTVAASLGDCAKNFLGYEVNALSINTPRDDDRPSPDLQHLALCMLESALTLKPNMPSAIYQAQPRGMYFSAGKH
jgi:hypothetical protein